MQIKINVYQCFSVKTPKECQLTAESPKNKKVRKVKKALPNGKAKLEKLRQISLT